MVNLHYFDIIILISACQSLFLAVFIMQKYWNSVANRTLSLLFFSYMLVLIEMFLWDIKFFYELPGFMLLLVGTPFLIGPLHYLYARYLTHYSVKFETKHLLHFIPFLLYEISTIPSLFTPKEKLISGITSAGENGISAASLILNWLIMFHIIFYTVIIALLVRKYSHKIKDIFSSIDKIKLGWLRNVSVLFSTGITMYIIENTLVTGGILSNQYPLSSMVAPGLVYIMGYLVLLKSDIFASHEITEQLEQTDNLNENKNSDENETGALTQKYQRSGLSNEKAKEYSVQLLQLMEEKRPYLDSELTLNKLAELISIPPYHLSEVINLQLNQNFFDFVNKYRVEKVKSDLADPQKENLTLLAVAIDAGFNSKSSFNMVFKKQTGITPSEYRKNNLKTKKAP